MKSVSDLIGWMSRDGAPWRDYPPAEAEARDAARPRGARLGPVKARVHALITLSRIRGASVFDRDGRLSGQIADLSLEKATGRVVYALVAFGGFLGLGERLRPLPWALLHYDAEHDRYVVPVRAADIAAAPSLTAEDLEVFGAGDAAWRARLTSYYSPYLGMPAI